MRVAIRARRRASRFTPNSAAYPTSLLPSTGTTPRKSSFELEVREVEREISERGPEIHQRCQQSARRQARQQVRQRSWTAKT